MTILEPVENESSPADLLCHIVQQDHDRQCRQQRGKQLQPILAQSPQRREAIRIVIAIAIKKISSGASKADQIQAQRHRHRKLRRARSRTPARPLTSAVTIKAGSADPRTFCGTPCGRPPGSIPGSVKSSTERAIATWPSTATSVGVRTDGDSLDVCASTGSVTCSGWSCGPTPCSSVARAYEEKAERWSQLWPLLTVLPRSALCLVWSSANSDAVERSISDQAKAASRSGYGTLIRLVIGSPYWPRATKSCGSAARR